MFLLFAFCALTQVLAQELPPGYLENAPPPLEEYSRADNELVIGGLFPMTGRLASGGIQREAGARYAVDRINELGDMFPSHTLRLLSFTTATDEKETVRATLRLTDGYNVLGLIGAAASGNSQSAALIADIYNTPQISYSSTSTALSDKSRYPTFFRTVPPDSKQAQAIAAIIAQQGWKRVTVLHTVSGYGTSLNEIFQSEAALKDINIVETITILTTGDSGTIESALEEDMQAKIDPNLQKVFVIFGLYADAAKVLRVADRMGMAAGKHVFLSVDGVMQTNLLDELAGSDLTPGDSPLSPTLRAARARLTRLATGMIGTRPSTGSTTLYAQLRNAWFTLNSTRYAGAGDPTSEPNLYMPYAYDCVLTYAQAFKNLINRGVEVNTTTVLEELSADSFQLDGVTGPITFDLNRDRDGATYSIYNFQKADEADADPSFRSVGLWDGEVKYDDDANVQWTPEGLVDAPTDQIDCTGFEVVQDNGCVPCDSASRFDAETRSCVACGSGQQATDEGDGCRLSDVVLAAVILICLLVVLLSGAVIFYYLNRVRRQRKKEEALAQNAPALEWDQADEVQELSGESETAAGIVSLLDKSSLVTVSVKNGEVPTFSLSKGQRMPVNEKLLDVITISNKSNKDVHYEIFVPSGNNTFTCQVKPGVGVVRAKTERHCELSFTLLQTMKLDRRIKVSLDNFGAVYFPIRFEGEVSQRLDPDEIELFGKPIGDGAFGTVYRGRYRGTAVAVKVLRRQNELGSEQNNNFIKEIDLFHKLRNPYIVNFIGASYVPGKLCICTELLERGTVLELIQKAKISLALKVKLMLDAACAIEFLHENGVLYRDLKPDNLLVFSVSHNANVNCKLSDFGTARTVEDPTMLMQYSGGIGTPIYMAPELMNASKYNAKVDVYSFAMVCWELMAEKQPFHEVKRVWDLPRIVVDGLRPTINEEWPGKMRRLINDAWMQSHERRPSMGECVKILRDLFEKQRKQYEKSKKAKRKAGDGHTGPATARTGELNQLIDQGVSDMLPIEAQQLGMTPAADVEIDEDEMRMKMKAKEALEMAEAEAGGKKKKPKKKKK